MAPAHRLAIQLSDEPRGDRPLLPTQPVRLRSRRLVHRTTAKRFSPMALMRLPLGYRRSANTDKLAFKELLRQTGTLIYNLYFINKLPTDSTSFLEHLFGVIGDPEFGDPTAVGPDQCPPEPGVLFPRAALDHRLSALVNFDAHQVFAGFQWS
jgi:hypothetical protein